MEALVAPSLGVSGRAVAAAAVAAVCMALVATVATMAEDVRFHSAPVPPSAFKMRLAQERGEIALPEPTQEIGGALYRPDGQGPFPAVVVLHGCSGRSSDEAENAKRFTALGYVTLYVDSLRPRGVRHTCTGTEAVVDRLMDALGALDYLAVQDFVRADRIAVVGASQGGAVVLRALALDAPSPQTPHRFAAAVAYYPICDRADVYAPTLILVGELDDWTPAADCREMMRKRTGAGAPVRLVVYPGAHHDFDIRRLAGKPRTYFGHHLEYNEAVDTAAYSEMAQFLKETIGRK